MDAASAEDLPDEAVVVRAGTSPLDAMKESVEKTKQKQKLRGQPEESLLSVFTHPSDDAEAIVLRAPILVRWTKIRLSTAGELRGRGFSISLPDDEGHANVKLPDDPSDDDYRNFLAAFSDPIGNPACED